MNFPNKEKQSAYLTNTVATRNVKQTHVAEEQITVEKLITTLKLDQGITVDLYNDPDVTMKLENIINAIAALGIDLLAMGQEVLTWWND